ncbi:MAG TPA: 2Fe-2S iron-sulfur cluster-binding protein, partial [Brevibacterium sp.]|nr:2Fe-2S iron-sulfur cluster-binding protein [Brevibacterium sp.]
MADTTQTAEPASKVDLPAHLGGGGGGEIPSFDVTFRIARFDPEQDEAEHWEDYTVTMYGTDRVLDGLHKIKWDIDGSLSFRRSCAHGVCGSDAMRI